MIRVTLLFFTLLSTTFCYSQVDINLILNHQFNGQPFLYSQDYQDENGNTINISRLQYYVSSIEITHNSGVIRLFQMPMEMLVIIILEISI